MEMHARFLWRAFKVRGSAESRPRRDSPWGTDHDFPQEQICDPRRPLSGASIWKVSCFTLGRIIRPIDGPLAPVRCVSVTGYKACEDCPDEMACPIRTVMKEVRDAMSRVLDIKTLDAVLRAGKHLKVGGCIVKI